MADEKVYSLKLDVSDLINNYRKAIDEMSKGGIQPKAIKQLTAALDKLEDKTKLVQSEGAAGFKGEGGLESYRKRVDRLLISFGQMDREIGKINTKISTFKSQAEVAGEKVKKAFTNLGIQDVEGAFQRVLQSENKQAAAEKEINQEFEKRYQLYLKMKQAYDQIQAKAKTDSIITPTGSIKALGGAFNAKGQIFSKEEKFISPVRGAKISNYEKLIQVVNNVIQGTKNLDVAWSKIESRIKSDSALSEGVKNWKAFETQIRSIVQYIEQKSIGAGKDLHFAEQSMFQIGTKAGGGGRTQLNQANLAELTANVKNYEEVFRQLNSVVNLDQVSFENLDKVVSQVSSTMQSASSSTEVARKNFQKIALETINTARAARESTASFNQLKNMVLMFLSATSMFHLARRQITKTYEEVKQLDKSFASIAMVTTSTVSDMWKTYSQYADMAAKLGQRTNSVVEASALFRQQGLDTNEALKLTTDTMKLATLAGSDYKTATQEMTTAVRGFKMEMTNGAHVTDVYSTLAAHAAATVDDIASAMARTSSIANSAGMSFENTSAFLTQMIETTQESSENIGFTENS